MTEDTFYAAFSRCIYEAIMLINECDEHHCQAETELFCLEKLYIPEL